MFVQPLRIFALWLFLASTTLLQAAEPEKTPSFAELAEKRYLTARAAQQKDPADVEMAWHFARACFDWADLAPNDDRREKIANEGITVMRKLIAQHSRLVQGHYYLAMNLGQVARTKSIGALRIVDEMEREFKLVKEIDPQFDHAGGDRNLGMLYHEAPGWPASIGNGKKARQHLENARTLSPDFPENHIYLLEAYLKWGDKKAAQAEFESLQKLMPEMKKKFAGDQWIRDWLDWDRRWKRILGLFSK